MPLTVAATVEIDAVWRQVANTSNPVVALQPKFFQGFARPYPDFLTLEFMLVNPTSTYFTQPEPLTLFDGVTGNQYDQWTILPDDKFRLGQLQRRWVRSTSLVGLVCDVAIGTYTDLET